MTTKKQSRKLTQPELNHLLTLLESARDEGSYYGPRKQYYARTERLIKWCKEQLEASRWNRSAPC